MFCNLMPRFLLYSVVYIALACKANLTHHCVERRHEQFSDSANVNATKVGQVA